MGGKSRLTWGTPVSGVLVWAPQPYWGSTGPASNSMKTAVLTSRSGARWIYFKGRTQNEQRWTKDTGRAPKTQRHRRAKLRSKQSNWKRKWQGFITWYAADVSVLCTARDHVNRSLTVAPLGTKDRHSGKVCTLMSEVEGTERFQTGKGRARGGGRGRAHNFPCRGLFRLLGFRISRLQNVLQHPQ